MRKYTPAIVAVVAFVIGCAAAPFVVPPLSAQQQNVQRWEYLCFDELDSEDVMPLANRAGSQGWEMVVAGTRGHLATWCFKRPL